MKRSRRESRETAFALLFQWSFQPDETLEGLISMADDGGEVEVDDFARELCGRAMDKVEELDGLIEAYSDRWKIGRLSKVTLAALRLALCEMSQFSDIPAGASINEAVELVKTFGTEDEASYVNGVLGSYERSRKKETP